MFCLIDVEWKLYEANLPRRLSILWEARCLNRVAHLSEGLDASVEHTEFAVGPSVTQLANGVLMSGQGLVSRVTPVHTAVRNCTRDEGGPFEVGNQVLISSHRKLLWSKAVVVNVAEKSERDFDRYD